MTGSHDSNPQRSPIPRRRSRRTLTGALDASPSARRSRRRHGERASTCACAKRAAGGLRATRQGTALAAAGSGACIFGRYNGPVSHQHRGARPRRPVRCGARPRGSEARARASAGFRKGSTRPRGSWRRSARAARAEGTHRRGCRTARPKRPHARTPGARLSAPQRSRSWFENYLAFRRSPPPGANVEPLRPATLASYEGIARTALGALGERNPAEVSTHDVRLWHASIGATRRHLEAAHLRARLDAPARPLRSCSTATRSRA